MSNTERQRKFRERNPGYYGRLHRKRKAEVAAFASARKAIAATIAVKREPLMLPAPVEVLVFPGLKTIEALCVPASQACRQN